MFTNRRPALPVGVTTLPAECYTDRTWFDRELHAIHTRFWLGAGRLEELPDTGHFVRRRFAGVDFLIVRGANGSVAAFHNVCRHRGTLLCTDDAGLLAGSIQCPYHAWTYGLDGRLLRAPHMDRVEGFQLEDYPLKPIALAQWDGHLFVNLAESPMPFAEYTAGLVDRFRPWRMADLRRVERRVYDVRANWKLILQNYNECLHCPNAHPLLNRQSHYLSGENEAPQPTYLGGWMALREGMATHSFDGRSNRACFRELGTDDRRRVYYYAMLPAFLLNLHPDYMMTFQVWPFAPDRTEIVCEWHFHPDEIARAEFDPSSPIGFWDLTNRQDWELCERAQAGIASRGYQPGPYSNREDLLIGLDRWVLEKLAE